jgi:sugar (pentulose or hexulose) kinase
MEVSCVIDFGQSYLKFNLITPNYLVIKTQIKKNDFKVSINNFIYYDGLKIEKAIKSYITKLSKKFKITSIVPIAHGSGCFFINSKNKVKSGFHFSSDFNNKKLLTKYQRSIPEFAETFTPNYKQFHNLGKNLFLMGRMQEDLELMTIPSFISWLFTKKNIIDPSYISCHSYLWNFKKKKFSNFTKSDSIKIPSIKSSGADIGYIKDKFFIENKNCKIYNGMHDTSAAFHFHKNFFNDQNTIFLSTGTTFVFGKFLKTVKKLKESSNFYYLLPANQKGVILSRRFHGGLLFNDLQNKKTKFTNRLLALNTINELNTYTKYISSYNVKLIIDGPFAKNKEFLFNLKKYKENINIYYAKNKNTPSLGIVYLCSKKKIRLSIKDYYKKYK